MLAERSIDWTVQWKQQGRLEGRQEGESQLLRRQLKRRFGPELPAWVDTRLANADTDQLEAWADAFVDARTLDEVFGP